MPLFAIVLPVLGALCIYAAVGVWLGVDTAIGGERIPGRVVDLRCTNPGGRQFSCSGTFSSDDGQIRNLHVRVSGADSATSAARGMLVPKIDTGLVGSIQSVDTVYLHGVHIDVVASIVIAVLLSLVGLVILVPFVAIGLAMLLGRRPRRGGPNPGRPLD